MITEPDVPCAMRDGTVLRADIYRPDGPGRYPVMLTRLPYDKGTLGALVATPERTTGAGYGVVVQDTRGRYASEGAFDPYLTDVEDGYDTVEWAARLPWSDGHVGMFGPSYLGYTQLAAASARPPSLVATMPVVTRDDIAYVYTTGGAFGLLVFQAWCLSVGQDLTRRQGVEVAEIAEFNRLRDARFAAMLRRDFAAVAEGQQALETFLLAQTGRVPLDAYPPLKEAVPFYRTWLHHPFRDDYWRQRIAGPPDAGVPSLQVAGWYDLFVAGQLKNYAQLRRQAGAGVGQRQRLIVGPWGHTTMVSRFTGEMDFGAGSVLDQTALRLEWFDHWLKGKPLVDQPPVRLFVMGINRWREEETWPLPRAVDTDFFLHSKGEANSLDGDGRLGLSPPEAEAPDRFTYDPNDPVPTRGGCLNDFSPGVFDQRPVEQRPDVLVYTSEPMPEDLEVTGPVRVHLWAATDGPGTDFTAKLVDAHPDGYAANLCDGILRSTHREGDTSPARTETGGIYEYVIELGPTSHVFKAGHRIRLEVSSSNFPRFDRNPNTGELPASATTFRVARQTVFHAPGRASRIVLPVVPG